jgi:hypothetical protein
MSQIIQSPTTTYVIGDVVKDRLTKSTDTTVYLVADQADGQWYMLKVSSDTASNGFLDREALVLRDIEAAVKRIRADEPDGFKGGAFRFEKCFPRLQESFLFKEQGNRRINIIAVPAADLGDRADLMPLERYRTRRQLLIDPKTSTWLMGRLLKIFALTHPIGVSVGQINGGNILVRPGEKDLRAHRALFFDWTKAHQYEQVVPPEKVGEEIAQAATQVFIALGGNVGTGTLPASDQLVDNRYAELLVQFMSGRERDPDMARQRFYNLVRDMWDQEFHPFTTTPL